MRQSESEKPMNQLIKLQRYTVAPAITASSIKRPPALSGQFQSRPFIFSRYFHWFERPPV